MRWVLAPLRRVEKVTVVGPHWTVCAQVQAFLGNTVKVGCETPEGDDFQYIHPRAEWERDTVLLYVADDRFPVDLPQRFPDRSVTGVRRTSLLRGGVVVRTLRVTQLTRVGAG